MRLVLFFLVLIQITDALNCINGFTSINNKCLRLISADSIRGNARRQCNLFGGNLVSIHNSIDNTAVSQFAFSNTDPIWIGITCSASHNPSSCIWDDQLGNASSYSNFIAGNPSTEIGQCVFMLTTGSLRGKWLSGDCDATPLSYVCETDPIGQCSHYYNGYCYYPLGELTESEAQLACAQNCNGNLVSIHGASENSYIQSLFQDPSKPYAKIGAQLSNNSNSWTDGSSWNYTNIGYQNSALGSCYSMSLVNEVVSSGKWISSNCSSPQPSVCKWLASGSCVSPTLAPPQCTGPTYLADSGNVYSPNYPYAYTATDYSPCYYILTTSTDTAAVWFDDFDIDPNSSLELYSSVDSQTPFVTLNQSTQGILDKTFTSTTSIIKMIFKPCTQNCDTNRNYRFSARFGKLYPKTSNTNMTANGVFTSPYYPNQYLNNMNWVFLLTSATSSKIRLHFDTFNTEASFDFVRIYDGRNTSAPLIATLSGSLSPSNLTFTSSSDSMFLTLITDRSNTASGFLATFNDYP